MKKLKTVLVLLSLLLVISCSSDPTADITLKTDGLVPQTYVMTDANGTVHKGTVLKSSPEVIKGLPLGDVAISYYGCPDLKRVAVATAGKDGDVILTQKESVPRSVFSSSPDRNAPRTLTRDVMNLYGEYSFFIFNEDGTGWKTTLKVDVKNPEPCFVTVAVGWKLDGSSMIISEDGKTPVHFKLQGDVIVSGGLSWEKSPEGEKGEKNLEGVWNILDIGSLKTGRPSPFTVQLSLRNNKVRLLASADAFGIPTEKVTSHVKADMELDVTDILSSLKLDIEKLVRKTSFSSNGSLAVIEILPDVRIPLIRGNAEKEIALWSATKLADNREVKLSDILNYIDGTSIKVDGETTVSVKDILSLTDKVVSASGKSVDISGSWKVGDDTWTTYNSISISDKGKVVVHVPERSGFHVIEVALDKSKAGVIYHGYYNVELAGNTLTYSGKDIRTATLVDRTPKTVKNTVDAALELVFKDKTVTSDNFMIAIKNGNLVLTAPEMTDVVLADATVNDGKIGFRHVLDTDKVWAILNKLGIEKVLAKDPKLTYDLVFPLTSEGKIEILIAGDKTLTI